jgi:hypothetical protein
MMMSAGSQPKSIEQGNQAVWYEAIEACWDTTAPNAMSRSKGLEKQLQPMIGPTAEVRFEGQGADKDRSEIADL